MVEVILLKDKDSLGEMGKVVRVSSGYARNYLIPNNIAIPVTQKLVKQFEHKKRIVEAKVQKTRQAAEAVASKINKTKLQFERRAGDQGKLFGSVTSSDIVDALLKKNIEVDRKQIILADGPIKEVGKHKVDIRLFQDIKAHVLVEVKSDQSPQGEAQGSETTSTSSKPIFEENGRTGQ